MEMKRVQEIIDSEAMINVFVRGIPVYIQKLNKNETATVFPLDNMEHEQVVELKELHES